MNKNSSKGKRHKKTDVGFRYKIPNHKVPNYRVPNNKGPYYKVPNSQSS